MTYTEYPMKEDFITYQKVIDGDIEVILNYAEFQQLKEEVSRSELNKFEEVFEAEEYEAALWDYENSRDHLGSVIDSHLTGYNDLDIEVDLDDWGGM